MVIHHQLLLLDEQTYLMMMTSTDAPMHTGLAHSYLSDGWEQ